MQAAIPNGNSIFTKQINIHYPMQKEICKWYILHQPSDSCGILQDNYDIIYKISVYGKCKVIF